ncbi:hypothetical protein [Lactococcus garvieae]|uniref:hypothetical protein n=1 Tax=Lactococcus garvieae TaxID=1363 RepID=UPI0011508BB3|nr:hypothetical protein [Lactococcus garvieae]
MKIKIKLALISFFFLLSPTVAFADATTDFNNFTSYAFTGDSKFNISEAIAALIHTFIQGLFFPVQKIYDFVSIVKTSLEGQDLINTWSSVIFDSSKTLYTQLFNSGLIYAIAGGLVCYLMWGFVKGAFGQIVMKVLILLLTSASFFAFGPTIVKNLNTNLAQVNKEIVSSVNIAGVEKTSADDTLDILLMKPFIALNFDSQEQALKDDRYKTLLEKHEDEDLKKYEKEWKDKHLGSSSFGDKFCTVIGALLNALLYGTLLLGFSIGSFALQLVVLLLLFLGAFAAILSLFPTFEKVLGNLIKEIFTVLVLSILLTSASSIMFIFDGLITGVLVKVNINDYFFTVILKFLIYYLMYRYRRKIGKIFESSGISANLNSKLNKGRRIISNSGQALKKTAPVGLAMSAGGMALASTAKNVKSAPYKVMNATRNKAQNRDNKKLENPRDSEEFNKANASSLLNRNADEKRLSKIDKKLNGENKGMSAIKNAYANSNPEYKKKLLAKKKRTNNQLEQRKLMVEKRSGNYTQSKNEDEIKRKSDEKLQEERLKARRRAKEKLEMQREMLRRATERKKAQKKQTTSERVQRRMTKYNYDKKKKKV